MKKILSIMLTAIMLTVSTVNIFAAEIVEIEDFKKPDNLIVIDDPVERSALAGETLSLNATRRCNYCVNGTVEIFCSGNAAGANRHLDCTYPAHSYYDCYINQFCYYTAEDCSTPDISCGYYDYESDTHVEWVYHSYTDENTITCAYS